jgi:ribosome biogenesis GTPase A
MNLKDLLLILCLLFGEQASARVSNKITLNFFRIIQNLYNFLIISFHMPTKRQKRSEKKLKNSRKQKEKYPELLKKIVESSDIILEILDARFVQNTRNIKVEEEIIKQKKRIVYVLNKSDLTSKLKESQKLQPSVIVSCKLREGIKKLRDKIKIESKKIEKKDKEDKIVVGVIGYPNTGKSSLINLLIGRKSAGTGADAGFTKGIQKLKLTSEIILLDSPGVIPEKEYSGTNKTAIAKHTIVGGRSYSQVKEPEIVVANLIKEFRGVLEKHYRINAKGNSEILLEELGRKKRFLKKREEVNFDKTARFILKEWQEGKIII